MKRKLIMGLLTTGVLVGIFAVTLIQFTNQKPKENVLSVTSSPVTGTILFVSNHTGNQEIYQMSLETLQAINLTNNPSDDMNPQLTPDGRFMTFYSDRDGDNEIYQMNMRDKTLNQLTHNNAGDYDPSYSPDGMSIVFKSTRDDGFGDIFIMQPDGSGQKNLTAPLSRTEEWDPTFTNNGKSIVFVSRLGETHTNDELFTMNADGSNYRQLTTNYVADWYPVRHPVDPSFAFVSTNSTTTFDTIFISDERNFTPKQIINITGGSDDPAWDATGQRILFINNQDGDYDLYIASKNGENVTKIADTSSDELSPIFLP